MRDLATLPKAHLHLHLEGGMRPSTLAELAAEHDMEVPVVSGFGSFSVFAAMYVAACDVLRRPSDMVRLVEETADDAVAAGAVYIEPELVLRNADRFVELATPSEPVPLWGEVYAVGEFICIIPLCQQESCSVRGGGVDEQVVRAFPIW